MAEATEAMDRALAAGDRRGWAAADDRFHRTLLQASGNARLARLAQTAADQAQRARSATAARREDPAASIAEHAAILAALYAGEPEPARPRSRRTGAGRARRSCGCWAACRAEFVMPPSPPSCVPCSIPRETLQSFPVAPGAGAGGRDKTSEQGEDAWTGQDRALGRRHRPRRPAAAVRGRGARRRPAGGPGPASAAAADHRPRRGGGRRQGRGEDGPRGRAGLAGGAAVRPGRHHPWRRPARPAARPPHPGPLRQPPGAGCAWRRGGGRDPRRGARADRRRPRAVPGLRRRVLAVHPARRPA